MKILLVDDDPVSRTVLAKILALHPEHKVTVVDNGDDAWAILDDPGRSFDVAFFDIGMPAPDGFELIKRVRQAPLLKSLEIVLTTGSSDRTTVTKAIKLGVRHYIVKPCSEAVIALKLQQIQAGAGTTSPFTR